MKYITIIIIFFSLLQSFAGEKENKEVKKVIKQGISLLETNKTKEYLHTLISPHDLKEKKFTIDEKFIDGFNKYKKDKVLEIFKMLTESDPEISKEKVVSFKVKDNQYMTFKSYENKWYISDSKRKPVED